MKTAVKRASRPVIQTLSSMGFLDPIRTPFLRSIAPRFGSVLRNELQSVLLRDNTPILANPFTYTHRRPFWFGQLYEWRLERFLRQRLCRGGTFIDVGANAGHFTVLAANLAGPLGKVVAFEPIPFLAERIREHCASNYFDSVTLHSMALGDTKTTATLHVDPKHLGGSSLLSHVEMRPNAYTITVPVERGDDVLPRHRRAIVKIDVEGFEPSVIRGMSGFIAECADAVVVEVTPEWIDSDGGVSGLFERMQSLGLSAYNLDAWNGRGRSLPTVNAAAVTEPTNVVFARKDWLASRPSQ